MEIINEQEEIELQTNFNINNDYIAQNIQMPNLNNELEEITQSNRIESEQQQQNEKNNKEAEGLSNENSPTNQNKSDSNSRLDRFSELTATDNNNNNRLNTSIEVIEVTHQWNQSQPLPQPHQVLQHHHHHHQVLSPPSINITDEFGHHTGSIDIDPNNSNTCYQQQPHSYEGELTESMEKNAAVLVKNVSFSYTKKNAILSNITLTVPKGK